MATLTAALLAAGCTDGSETNASSPGTTAPAATASTVIVLETLPPFEPRRITIIGDSISVGSEAAYHDSLPLDDVEVVATSGIRLGAQRDAIEMAVATEPDVLVIELGTNDVPLQEPEFLDGVDEVLAETSELPCVRWVTVYAPNLEAEVDEINDHLRDATERYDNLELVDWFQMVQDEPDLLSDDGLHPSEFGQAALGKAVADSTVTCS